VQLEFLLYSFSYYYAPTDAGSFHKSDNNFTSQKFLQKRNHKCLSTVFPTAYKSILKRKNTLFCKPNIFNIFCALDI